MTTTSRQNNLILNEDWTRIYQTFQSADFKSYDFENLRRVIIAYYNRSFNRGIYKHLRGLTLVVGHYVGMRDDGACLIPWNFQMNIGNIS